MTKKKKKFEWGYLLLIPGLGFVAFFEFSALGMMILQSFGFLNFTGESKFSLEYWKALFGQNFFDNMFYSLKIAVLASLICLAIVYPLCMAVKNMPGEKLCLAFLKLPQFIPAMIVTMVITNMISYNGIVNGVLVSLGILDQPIMMRNDAWGIGNLITQVWKNTPFMLMLLYSAVQGVRKDVLDAGRNLGASRFRLFWEVTFPLTLPSALVAAIMTFIKIFNDYTIAKIMGPIYPSTLSNLMHKQAYLYDDWHSAACIGCFMTVTALIFVTLYTKIGNWFAKRISGKGVVIHHEEES